MGAKMYVVRLRRETRSETFSTPVKALTRLKERITLHDPDYVTPDVKLAWRAEALSQIESGWKRFQRTLMFGMRVTIFFGPLDEFEIRSR
jgi:hypothetical protein